ncbi:hypothetical protein FRY74_01025 [Vicingus serpentipes]|uniref:Uncharacterized protein n=1 Tax=Vicingus serpentipes TaxID=1926625 RepID=A0A5C6RW59_9FLAO|nr:hypothetical protein [Vicingus serpentipes]TXB66796.1 hypothetical protein FRY74_01025 [Vicingus serpentipes]
MKKLITILLFLPLGLFAQGTLEVVNDSNAINNNDSFEVIQTEDGTLKEAYFIPSESQISITESKTPGTDSKNKKPLFISIVPEIKD